MCQYLEIISLVLQIVLSIVSIIIIILNSKKKNIQSKYNKNKHHLHSAYFLRY